MKWSGRNWRWSILLPMVHIAIAAAIIGAHETNERSKVNSESLSRQEARDEFDRQSRIRQRKSEHRFFASLPDEEKNLEWGGIDFSPPAAIKAMYAIELPACVLVGWYKHPLMYASYPLLWPLLGVLADTMPLRTRTVVFDLLLVAAIALQWWIIGKFVERQRGRKHEEIWSALPAVISIAALVFVAAGGLIMGVGYLNRLSGGDNSQLWSTIPAIILALFAFVAGMAPISAWACLICLMLFEIAQECWVRMKGRQKLASTSVKIERTDE